VPCRDRGHGHAQRQAQPDAAEEVGAASCAGAVGEEGTMIPSPEVVTRYPISARPEEHIVWSRDVKPALPHLSHNVLDIWQYSFTEMFNNAVDHSGGSEVTVKIARLNGETEILVQDDGVGIFRKIRKALGLLDERHAILELSKGKLTTDPEKHSGQGIFFTSRMVDEFGILSGGVYFSHKFGEKRDWALEELEPADGTSVFMRLANQASRTPKEIFDQYSSGDDYGFTKTVVPLKLAQYGDDKLVSRSQAKQVLVRVEQFKTAVFDFSGVETIGQAFADEIFRVFARSHPAIEIFSIDANQEIRQVIAAIPKSSNVQF
jgi:anti-sigma regulatory factor (Ser/Thr protein kinase)